MTDIGEYFVGAYLQYIYGCEIVVYNVKDYSLTGNIAQNEIDVIGICFKTEKTYLCEVKTHIQGFKATGKTDRVKLVHSQFNAMQKYAHRNLPANHETEYMFWAPNKVQNKLKKEIDKLYSAHNIIVDDIYKTCLEDLIQYAGNNSTEFDNPFIRTLQIAKWSKAI
jgi:hypothetical protein